MSIMGAIRSYYSSISSSSNSSSSYSSKSSSSKSSSSSGSSSYSPNSASSYSPSSASSYSPRRSSNDSNNGSRTVSSVLNAISNTVAKVASTTSTTSRGNQVSVTVNSDVRKAVTAVASTVTRAIGNPVAGAATLAIAAGATGIATAVSHSNGNNSSSGSTSINSGSTSTNSGPTNRNILSATAVASTIVGGEIGSNKEARIIKTDSRNLFSYGDGDPSNQLKTQESKSLAEIQKALEKLGYLDTNGKYGYFGELTRKAINKYKNDKGLDNTGLNADKVGITTLSQMNKDVLNLETIKRQKATMEDSRNVLKHSQRTTDYSMVGDKRPYEHTDQGRSYHEDVHGSQEKFDYYLKPEETYDPHKQLDLLANIPGGGMVFDGLNIGIYHQEGNNTQVAKELALIILPNVIETGAKLGKTLVKNADEILESATKTVDDIASISKRNQKSIINSVENGSVKLETNIQKGNYGEMKMDNYYESRGYQRISNDRITDLNQSTHPGIDGVYYNPGPPPKYVIAEAKYNTGKLGTTKDGKQMSDAWIEGSNRLENAVGKDVADDILLAGFDKALIRVSPNGNVSTKVLDKEGKIIK